MEAKRRWRLGILGVCGVLCGAMWLASRSQRFVEEVYAGTIGPSVARGLGQVSGLVPFSIGEILFFGFLLWLAVSALLGLIAALRRRRSWGSVLAGGVLRGLAAFAIVATLFYGLWGIYYARASLDQRLGWDVGTLADATRSAELLEKLATQLVDEVNRLNREVTARYPEGAASLDLEEAGAELDQAFERLAEGLGLEPAFAVPRGPAKTVTAGGLMSRLGIAGFYFPWTAEANLNPLMPRWQQLHTLAHEMTHQRGITSEDEANFLGDLACLAASDPRLRYAGLLAAQRLLLGRLLRVDPERAAELIRARDPGVQRDVDDARAFWTRYAGWMMDTAQAMNDGYLRLHRVEGGIDSYGRAVRLLLLYAARQGGHLRWGG